MSEPMEGPLLDSENSSGSSAQALIGPFKPDFPLASLSNTQSEGRSSALALSANDYADFIARTIAEPGAYGRLARSSAHRFATRAIWDVAVRDIGDRLARVTAPAPSPAARHRR